MKYHVSNITPGAGGAKRPTYGAGGEADRAAGKDYAEKIQQQFSGHIRDLTDVRPGKIRELASSIRRRWEELIDQYVKSPESTTAKGPRDYAKRYKAGIRVAIEGERILLVVKGFDAVSVERGWAPPRQRGDIWDGIGEWTGHERDMRTFLFSPGYSSGSIGTVTNPKTGETYEHRVLRMPLNKPAEGLAKEYEQNLGDVFVSMMERGGSVVHQRRRAKMMAAKFQVGGHHHLQGWEKGISQLEVGERLGDFYTNKLEKEQRKHAKPILSGITRTVQADGTRRWLFSTYRRVTTSRSQVRKRVWFTSGIKPVNLIEKYMPQEVLNIIAEKIK